MIIDRDFLISDLFFDGKKRPGELKYSNFKKRMRQ